MRSWQFTNTGMDGPNVTINETGNPVAPVQIVFHCDDGPGVEDWDAYLEPREAEWIRDRLIDILGLPSDRQARHERARADFLERGSKPTGKVSTGRGAATYAEDFTREERSAVADELTQEHVCQCCGRRQTVVGVNHVTKISKLGCLREGCEDEPRTEVPSEEAPKWAMRWVDPEAAQAICPGGHTVELERARCGCHNTADCDEHLVHFIQERVKQDPAAILSRAEAIDPGNSFVAGCRNAYERNGRLTEKQIAALKRVTPTRRVDLATPRTRLSDDGLVEPDDDDIPGLDKSWDWAGGE